MKEQKDSNEDYEVLVSLYNQAKAAKLGIHTGTLLFPPLLPVPLHLLHPSVMLF